MSHKREISTQHSLARNRAARLQRRVEAVFRPQFCQGQRGGEQLHVRSRHEILVCVLLVQGLAAFGIHNEEPPLPLVCGYCSQQRFRPRGESRPGLLRRRALFLWATTYRLCLCFRLRARAWRAGSESPHGARHRHRRTSLQDFLNSHFSLALKSFSEKYSPKATHSVSRASYLSNNSCRKPVYEAPFLRSEVAPSLRA